MTIKFVEFCCTRLVRIIVEVVTVQVEVVTVQEQFIYIPFPEVKFIFLVPVRKMPFQRLH